MLQEEINRLRACEGETIKLKNDLREVQAHLSSADQGIKALALQVTDKDSEIEALRSKLKIAMEDLSHYRQLAQREQTYNEMEELPSKRLRTDTSLNNLLEVSPKL